MERKKVVCVLCKKSGETKITGPLSTKECITAHQNCLLYSSGICCQHSPEFDDLFGFSVEDVLTEVKRGKKLPCHRCKKSGATAGCEIRRCKRTYHYPCAVQVGAKIVEDEAKGKYTLYCSRHGVQAEDPKAPTVSGSCDKSMQTSQTIFHSKAGSNDTGNGHGTSFRDVGSSETASEVGSSKVCCLTCEKKEGNVSLESLNNNIVMLYCDKHAPSSHKNSENTPSLDFSIKSGLNFKRKLNFNNGHEGRASKLTRESWKKRLCSDSDQDEPNSELAPIESDPDEGPSTVPELQRIRRDADGPAGSTAGNGLAAENTDDDDDDETIIESDAESDSVVEEAVSMESDRQRTPECSPTRSPSRHSNSVHSPGSHPAEPSPPPDIANPTSPPSQGPAGSQSPRPTTSVPTHCSPTPSLHSLPPSPTSLHSVPELTLDATSFWKSCNAAGCTEAIFSEFITDLNRISSRIQSDQASQEDYNVALKVIMSSGKLIELVSKQHAELKKKQLELQNAAGAMQKIMSALR